MRAVACVGVIVIACLCTPSGVHAQDVPADFPRFIAPGNEQVAESFRRMHWLHYPGAGPKATLWDEETSSCK